MLVHPGLLAVDSALMDILETCLPGELSLLDVDCWPVQSASPEASWQADVLRVIQAPSPEAFSLRVIGTIDPTLAFCGELASMVAKLWGFDITLHASPWNDISAMLERVLMGLGRED